MIGINRRAGGHASNRNMQYSAIDRGWLAIGRGWSERQGASKISWAERESASVSPPVRSFAGLAVSLSQHRTGASTTLTLLPLAEKAGPAWLILAVLTIHPTHHSSSIEIFHQRLLTHQHQPSALLFCIQKPCQHPSPNIPGGVIPAP